MKIFQDGDRLVLANDDFVSLQESPAVFLPLEDDEDVRPIDQIMVAFAKARQAQKTSGFMHNDDGSIWFVHVEHIPARRVVICPVCENGDCGLESRPPLKIFLCPQCGEFWSRTA